MLPSSSEVAFCLSAVWRSMDEGERAFARLDLSPQAVARSFGAILLTLPAIVAIIAAERLRHGLSNEAGLLDAPWLVASVVAMVLMSFLAPPAFIVALFWRVARTARGTGFLIVWNWTGVLVTLILAAPLALFAAGMIKGALAAIMVAAFSIIALRLRYAVARSVLGLDGISASVAVALAFAIEIVAAVGIASLGA